MFKLEYIIIAGNRINALQLRLCKAVIFGLSLKGILFPDATLTGAVSGGNDVR